MKYSQNNEQSIIENYFKEQEGSGTELVVLSIGENDGKTLSNSLACIERGWRATLVEPSKKAFEKMCELHNGKDKVQMLNVAIGDTCGEVTFHESGEHAKHLYGENHSLLSTIKKDETARWKNETFTETKVNCLTVEALLEQSENGIFDLISIDAEGYDFNILSQFDLNKVKCQMLIIENNGEDEWKYVAYCSKYRMKLIDKTPQNLIFAR